MKEIIVGDKSRIIRMSDDFALFGIDMKPREYILYLSIFQLIQKRNTYNDINESTMERFYYDIPMSELSGLFDKKTYQEKQFKELIDNMLENQSEDILDDITINEKSLHITFDLHYYNKYFGKMDSYITADICDFIGKKNINDIRIMILFCKFYKSGWVKITEYNMRLLLKKQDIQTKHLTRDIKSIIKKLNKHYTINNIVNNYWDGTGFKISNGKNGLIYEFKFNSFKYVYKKGDGDE